MDNTRSGMSRTSSGAESVSISLPSPTGGEQLQHGSGGGGDGEIPWHTLATPEDVFRTAGTSAAGLPEPEAAARRAVYGPNRMTARGKRTMLQKVWDQLNSIIMFILIISAIVSGAFEDWKEFALILAVVVVNVLIGVLQEGKAEKATEAIKAMLSSGATVLRGGERVAEDALTLVPGDVVFIQSGDRLPADVRWVATSNLQVRVARRRRASCATCHRACRAR